MCSNVFSEFFAEFNGNFVHGVTRMALIHLKGTGLGGVMVTQALPRNNYPDWTNLKICSYFFRFSGYASLNQYGTIWFIR